MGLILKKLYIDYIPEQQIVRVDCEEGVFEIDAHLEDDPIYTIPGDYFTPTQVICTGQTIQEKAEDLWRFNRDKFIEIL